MAFLRRRTREERERSDRLMRIERFGWTVEHVRPPRGSSEVRRSYTVGLTAHGHPEVVVLGLPFEAAVEYLNQLGERVRAGARFEDGGTTAALTDESAPVSFLAVHDAGLLPGAVELYGEITAVQLVWPDSTGRLPWEEGHRNSPEVQPLLGPRPRS